MKKLFSNTIAVFVLTFLISSCTKENISPASMETVPDRYQRTNTVADRKSGSIDPSQHRIVSLCGRKFNYVEPPSGTWALSIKIGNTIRKFGVPTRGEVNFTNIDWVKFEFSGLYADAGQTIKLYRIKRNSDNKVLTFQLGLQYLDPQPDLTSIQLWSFEGLSDNSYRFTTAGFTSCLFAYTYPSNGQYRIAGTYMEGAAADANFAFYFVPVNNLPPNIN